MFMANFRCEHCTFGHRPSETVSWHIITVHELRNPVITNPEQALFLAPGNLSGHPQKIERPQIKPPQKGVPTSWGGRLIRFLYIIQKQWPTWEKHLFKSFKLWMMIEIWKKQVLKICRVWGEASSQTALPLRLMTPFICDKFDPTGSPLYPLMLYS